MDSETASPVKVAWNKGKIVAQKAPLKLKDIWAIRRTLFVPVIFAPPLHLLHLHRLRQIAEFVYIGAAGTTACILLFELFPQRVMVATVTKDISLVTIARGTCLSSMWMTPALGF